MNTKLWFKNICSDNHFSLTNEMADKLEMFHALIAEWNKKMNLISRKDEQNIWSKHILASLSFAFHFRLGEESTVLDLGTGGGLPGIPLAITHPLMTVILLDSINKKINAVKDIVQRIGLDNVDVLCGRAEEIGRKEPYKHSVDYVVARAVSTIDDIIKWSEPWLIQIKDKNGGSVRIDDQRILIPRGSIILLKGGNIQNEIEFAQRSTKIENIIIDDLKIKGINEESMTDKKIVILQYH